MRHGVTRFILFVALAPALARAAGAVLQPAFANYAQTSLPPQTVSPGGGLVPDTALPFSWNQDFVVREGAHPLTQLRGFDPQLQKVFFYQLPSTPEFVSIQTLVPQTGEVEAAVAKNTAGNVEQFPFYVQSRGFDSPDTYLFSYDIRLKNARIRGAPLLSRSPGTFIAPGQIVRFFWTKEFAAERKPKCEALLSGATGSAKGSVTSTLTELNAVKMMPVVLGHYVMTVTPRDVAGEPPRGSNSNGVVFQCAFGSDPLPPAADGLAADTFTPAVGQTVTIAPVATDPQTGQTTYANEVFDFGDGTQGTGSGALTHAFAAPGIYRVQAAVTNAAGLAATAADSFIVGATVLAKLQFRFQKSVIPAEAGVGLNQNDRLAVTFPNVGAQPGDRIIFLFNRNQFGRSNASDLADDYDIILKPDRTFTGRTRLALNLSVTAGPKNLILSLSNAQFDRTGDPRFNRCNLHGVFTGQRIALSVIPASGAAPRAYAYLGNVALKVAGGDLGAITEVPEQTVIGNATTRQPNPKTQLE